MIISPKVFKSYVIDQNISRLKYCLDQIKLFQPNEFIILDLKFTTIHNKLPKTFAPQKYISRISLFVKLDPRNFSNKCRKVMMSREDSMYACRHKTMGDVGFIQGVMIYADIGDGDVTVKLVRRWLNSQGLFV